MSLIKRMRKQKAVYWKRGTSPNKYGAFSYDAPVEIACRWDDRIENKMGADDDIESSRATVYVDRDMLPGDMLKLGAIESATPEDPTTATDAFEVIAMTRVKNFRNTETLYIAHLSWRILTQ